MKNHKVPLNERLKRIRHSAAHVMAHALKERFEEYGHVDLAGGMQIDDGFYYDFFLPKKIEPSDLLWVEKRMREIILEAHSFVREEKNKSAARKIFADQRFKLELLEDRFLELLNKESCQHESKELKLHVYRHGSFIDLCQGPHVSNSSEIPADGFKMSHVAGAYWKGNEKNPMLQRVYVICFESKKELNEHLNFLQEAMKRDHRVIGKELDLFFFSEDAPGMPYWLPNGLEIYHELISFWRREHKDRGYQEISSPIIHHQKIWEISGHWDHFRDEMFLIQDPKDSEKHLGMKPMNCPDAMVVFNYKKRSYRELPLRLADCDSLHRNEKSGALHGLLRARRFSQDDAHIFLMESQICEEIDEVLDIVEKFYSIFELSYSFRVGLRPEKFVGDPSQWNAAEKILLKILGQRFAPDRFSVDAGEGAFYGPKIDILIKDSLGRNWQMGSIQLDFQLPSRFDCKFVNDQGGDEVPIVIHRVIYGSMERFIGILLEHFAGRLPPWIAPVQLAILGIADRHMGAAENVSLLFRKAGLRSIVLPSKDRISARIRHCERQKIPFIAIIGDREVQEGKISLRGFKNQPARSMSATELLELVQLVCKSKRLSRDQIEG